MLAYHDRTSTFTKNGHFVWVAAKFSDIFLGSKVIAVGIHTEDCTNEEAFAFQKQYEQKLNIPVLLPIQEGVDKIVPTLKKLIKN